MESVSKLKKKFDQIFSRYIRLKYADVNGLSQCFTCLKKAHYKELQCGHYITRNHLFTRWSEDNCRPQCAGCNLWGGGKPFDFEERLIKEIGPAKIQELKNHRHDVVKHKASWYEERIKEYEIKVAQLSKVR